MKASGGVTWRTSKKAAVSEGSRKAVGRKCRKELEISTIPDNECSRLFVHRHMVLLEYRHICLIKWTAKSAAFSGSKFCDML